MKLFKGKTKTYMKYENGKIVTIKEKIKRPPVYEAQKSNEPNLQQLNSWNGSANDEKYSEVNTEDINTAKDQLKAPLNLLKIWNNIIHSKIIKWILGAFLIAFFVFSFYDVYEKFAKPTSQTENIDTKNNPSNNTAPKPLDDISDTLLNSDEQDTFKLVIKTANVINQIIVTNTNGELQQLNAYINNKANIISTKNALEGYSSKKEKAYLVLADAKTIFEKEDAFELYQATENRLLNSINLTKSALSLLKKNGARNEIEQEMNDFAGLEEKYTQEQKDAILKILDERNIEYKYSSKTNEIEYIVD